MKKNMKILPIIFAVLLTISILGDNSNYFNTFKKFLLNKGRNNIVLFAPGDNSTNSGSESSTPNENTGDSAGQSPDSNSSTTGNSSGSSSSGSAETPANTNENNSTTTDETNIPSNPQPVVEPQQTPAAPASKPVENNVVPSKKTTNSSSGSSTSNYSKSKIRNSTSTNSSTSSGSSTSNTKDTTSKQEQVESKTTENPEVQPAVSDSNVQVNNQEQTKDSAVLLIRSSLNKGDINLNNKSSGIKLTCDNPNFKEIYYLFSEKKDVSHDEKWIKYSSPLKFDKNGTWYIQYKAIDKTGNESYGNFGPYKVSYEYKTLGSNVSDNSFKKKIIGFSMIIVIIILATIYIIKTNKSPYSSLDRDTDNKKRRFHLGK
ncbi:hypothetical protein [Clostridium sp.]|jgi:hypothetical protein|uniref:hypothetical protein n=1 Tax=Clostridium sp. TaxID=1506 RepID=UPI00258BEF54|nr:hypothetical protein [Clostridium sp.]MDF2502631.1 hypothetical protein [Clostridium sp.]